jgi:radical SAM-linked protein
VKVRFRYSKLGKLRWTSQRDMARMWERALRKAAVPVAFTSGFSPRPKLSFGLALPTGCESVAEFLDVEVATPVVAHEVSNSLKGHFPAGVGITAAAAVPDGSGSLQQDVTSCAWEIQVPGIEHLALERLVGRKASRCAANEKGARRTTTSAQLCASFPFALPQKDAADSERS